MKASCEVAIGKKEYQITSKGEVLETKRSLNWCCSRRGKWKIEWPSLRVRNRIQGCLYSSRL